MVRALIEFLFTMAVVLIARAVLSSVMNGISRASANSFGGTQANPGPSQRNSNSGRAAGHSKTDSSYPGQLLHKDPVCGTYVAEGSVFSRQSGGKTFYYCSATCREKHSLVA